MALVVFNCELPLILIFSLASPLGENKGRKNFMIGVVMKLAVPWLNKESSKN